MSRGVASKARYFHLVPRWRIRGTMSPIHPTSVWYRHILNSLALHRNLYTLLYKTKCRTSVKNLCKSTALTWTACHRYSYLPESCALLDCYTISGNFSPTFRDSQSVPSSLVSNPPELQGVLHPSGKIFWIYELLDSFGFLTPEDGTDGCRETSVRNYHNSLRSSPEERSSQLRRAEAWHHVSCTSYLREVGINV